MGRGEELLALAARVEALTGADAETDMLVWAALNGVTDITYPDEAQWNSKSGRVEGRDEAGLYLLLGWIDPGVVQRNWRPYGGEGIYPKFTASLDAAMTLVPEGWTAWKLESRGGLALFSVEISRLNDATYDEDAVTGFSSSPAPALTAAALRARASQSSDIPATAASEGE